MAGYHGHSMSNNAIAAYESGERPWSRWTKALLVAAIDDAVTSGRVADSNLIPKVKRASLEVLRRLCLVKASWHHTSKNFNRTNFYRFDEGRLANMTLLNLRRMEITVREEQTRAETWLCSYMTWSGPRNHLVGREETAIGVIRGNWFYLPDGHKKKVTGVGFQKLKKMGDGELQSIGRSLL